MAVLEPSPLAVDIVAPDLTTVKRSKLAGNVNLVTELAITQFKLKYTGSLLGYLWSLLKPAMLFGITYVIFAVVLKAGGTDHTFPVQLLIGIVMWTFFADATATSISAIASNGNIIRKAYFPRWTLVAASTASALLTFVINLFLVLAITVPLGGTHIGWTTLLVPLFLLELYALVLGIGLLLSALFVFYRDVGHLWEVFSQVLFYGSMILFPLARVSEHGPWRTLIFMNPVAQIVEDMRHILVGASTAPWTEQIVGWGRFFIPIGMVALVLAIGVSVFRVKTPQFAEAL